MYDDKASELQCQSVNIKGTIGKADSTPGSLGSSAAMVSVSSAMVPSPFHYHSVLLRSLGDNRREGNT